ncbi:hypothetical protein TMatcc_006176 [Talaromyces marneffei ATCC 18224]|uniref:Uncharacterized protein n=2 Tax=Talaromyces marneffei TaxID=37727 RepID=B6QC99_TALMQ|nr:uncharacterized protein EYB26_002863 [Talaromyces marneffei]EEA25593.1 conserved hypothetical protein [Talaromyces marneffei ATCC 18224]EEA25594.1 conserved hypothetical protein [Talaromyces marneffei ATCC 18224]KAE8554311.1 hypothetical protein EYB25_002850 [Talaromyces marneffei]QGA15206.1 hypothetical protein EYB26_002863 [Talaromyces marneffei]
MRSLTILSTLYLTLFCSVPTLALTGGTAWVNFYKDCPNEISEIEELTFTVSSLKQSTGNRAETQSSPSPVHSTEPSPSSSASHFPSSSASLGSRIKPDSTSSSVLSKRSQFRSAIVSRNTETATIRSPAVNITQGQCQPVPIMTARHIDSGSVSVVAQLLTITPFQDCNITVHEVPGCIDEPLLVAPVENRQVQSTCTPRNFGAFSDVWVRLDCSEIGTDLKRPVRRVF